MVPVYNRRDNNYLKVVDKTFAVIETLAQKPDGVRLSDLSRTVKQPKATTFRILYTLSRLGYVEQDRVSGIYRLSSKSRWFVKEEVRETLKRVSRPYLGKLLNKFEQTVNLGLLDRDRILYIEVLEGLRSIRMSNTANTYAPLHCTALGKAILAFLSPEAAEDIMSNLPLTRFTSKTVTSIPALRKQLHEARSRGYAVDDEETERGARCVAAVVFDSRDTPLAAISVSGPITHISPPRVKTIAYAVVKICREISSQLGYLP